MISIKSNKLKKTVSIFAAITDLLLFIIKIYIAISSNSISIYVDSLNSLADTFVCLFAFIGFIVSAVEPNEKYPFGYGKTEELINLLLSTVILMTGFVFVYTSLQRLMYPVPVWYSTKYAAVIGGTALVKLIMGIVFNRIDKKHKSDIIKNLSVDSFLDFFMSFCIVISFTLTSKFGYAIDSVMGLVASFVIIISGIKSFLASCKVIIGKRDDRACEKAETVIKKIDGVAKINDIQCHTYGDRKIITAEITVSCSTAKESAELTQLLKNIIKNKLGYDLQVTVGGVL